MSDAPNPDEVGRFDSREGFLLAPRPKWLTALNQQGPAGWVPIEEQALLD